MKLYWLPNEHRYVHRMADVPKDDIYSVTEVPTDLAGLMGFLNELWQAHQIELCNAVVDFVAEHPVPERDEAPVIRAVGQTEVEVAIQAADPVQLASYAENVCWRIKELSKNLEK